MKFIYVSLLSTFLALVSSTPLSTDKPDPSKVYIESINYGGTGCPQGSVAKTISDDRSTFTLIFDQYVASTGPTIPITESRKACQINIVLHLPGGFSFTIGTVDYRGYVQLKAGAEAFSRSLYYFSGDTAQASCFTPFKGPYTGDYLIRNTIPLDAYVWSSCGVAASVNVKNDVGITGNVKDPNQITVDSIDGKVTHIFGLIWQRCNS